MKIEYKETSKNWTFHPVKGWIRTNKYDEPKKEEEKKESIIKIKRGKNERNEI